ncbi:MAG: secretin N-terminal domain-containing protein [Verrucomicrobiota bacterium]
MLASASPFFLYGQTPPEREASRLPENILIELPENEEETNPALRSEVEPASEPAPVIWVSDEVPAVPPVIVDTTGPVETLGDTTDLLEIPELPPQISREEEVIMQLPQGGAPAPVYGEEETISVNYLDEEVSTILRNVALLYDLNLVIPDTLVGRSSLKLSNVTWRQVFEVVLEATGFTYLEESNIIKVRSIEDLAVEPVDTRVFIINFANASEIQGSVAPLVNADAGGRIQVDKRSNALIITERPSRMNKIQEIIERLDRETLQVKIESKFVEVTDRDTKSLGINWSSLGGYEIGTSEITRTISKALDQTIEFTNPGPAENWNIPGDDYINQVTSGNPATVPPGYVPPNNVPYTPVLSDTDGNIATYTLPTSSLTNTETFSRADEVVLTADGFSVVLSALESLNDVKLVSNPTIVTLNNEPALISIGERYPIPSYTYNDELGRYEISNFEYQDIGINLEVTPQVNSAGFINLDILPEVSSRQGTVTFGGASGAEIPIIASRRTETTVTIKDGYTLALGGLMENETSTTQTKVPVLGDIPVLGRLFRSDADTLQTRNLIIFITAKTLSPDGSDYRDVIDPRMLNIMGIRESEVPGYVLSDEERLALDNIQKSRDDIDLEKTIASRRAELEQLEAARSYIEGQKDGTAEKLDDEWWRRD